MSIFKALRESKGITKYQAAKDLGLMQNEYQRLEDAVHGERYLRYLLKMLKLTGSTMGQVKKLIKEQDGKGDKK